MSRNSVRTSILANYRAAHHALDFALHRRLPLRIRFAVEVSLALVDPERHALAHDLDDGDKLVTVSKIIREKVPLGIYEVKGYLNGEADAKGLPAVEATVKCMMGAKIAEKK